MLTRAGDLVVQEGPRADEGRQSICRLPIDVDLLQRYFLLICPEERAVDDLIAESMSSHNTENIGTVEDKISEAGTFCKIQDESVFARVRDVKCSVAHGLSLLKLIEAPDGIEPSRFIRFAGVALSHLGTGPYFSLLYTLLKDR